MSLKKPLELLLSLMVTVRKLVVTSVTRTVSMAPTEGRHAAASTPSSRVGDGRSKKYGFSVLGRGPVAAGGGAAARVHFGPVLEVHGRQVGGAVLSPVRVGSVRTLVCVVEVAMAPFVTVGLRVSADRLEEPHLVGPLELSQRVRPVARLLLLLLLFVVLFVLILLRRSPLVALEAGRGHRATCLGPVEGRRRATVDGAGRKDGRHHGPQTLSGPGGRHRLGGRVGDVHPPDSDASELIGLGFQFILSLLERYKREDIIKKLPPPPKK